MPGRRQKRQAQAPLRLLSFLAPPPWSRDVEEPELPGRNLQRQHKCPYWAAMPADCRLKRCLGCLWTVIRKPRRLSSLSVEWDLRLSSHEKRFARATSAACISSSRFCRRRHTPGWVGRRAAGTDCLTGYFQFVNQLRHRYAPVWRLLSLVTDSGRRSPQVTSGSGFAG